MPNLELFFCMNKKTAVLVDGAFFLKRYKTIKRIKILDPTRTAMDMWQMCLSHLSQAQRKMDLYRIFYYDCLPYEKKQHNPVSGKSIDFKKTKQHAFRIAFFEELKKKRKIALRLGTIDEGHKWVISPSKTKELLKGIIDVQDLTDDDVSFDLKQKRVDMKIGLDIATITLKKQVDQIVLVSGDSDFVPAAKLARREGVDFILDPMYNWVKPHLFEHIDGMSTRIKSTQA